MGKSSSGPDWTDILMYAWEIEEATGYDVIILASLGGGTGGLPANVCLLASKADQSPWELGEAASVTVTWPNRSNKTMEGAIFAGLARLDAEVRKQSVFDIMLDAQRSPSPA